MFVSNRQTLLAYFPAWQSVQGRHVTVTRVLYLSISCPGQVCFLRSGVNHLQHTPAPSVCCWGLQAYMKGITYKMHKMHISVSTCYLLILSQLFQIFVCYRLNAPIA